MACLNETLPFAQPHFATSVSADFGYGDVTVTSSTLSKSSRNLSPAISLSSRFQPSPLPYLPNSSASAPKPVLQRSKAIAPSLQDTFTKESPHSDSKTNTLNTTIPQPDQKHSVLEETPSTEQTLTKRSKVEQPAKELSEEDVKRGEAPEVQDVSQDCIVSGKKSPAGEEPRKTCLEVAPDVMGDSKANKSPRSSTSDNLQTLSLKEHYEVEKELGRGTYGKVVLAKCRHTGTQVALKLLPKSSTKMRDFQREFQLSYFLSPHSSIIDTYNVAFETKSSFVFAQEHAPLGDLFDAIPPQMGMKEADAKSVVKQLASALEFMHSKHLVHRDIKPENVLVMSLDYSRVKLMDFGMTRKHGAMVRKTNGSIPYTPPEVCEAVRNENILVSASADVWALAVLLFCMLTGNFPWENADIGDMYFKEFVLWQRRKTTKLPSQWRRFSPRAMKFFRKALDIKPERRCDIGEIHKYLSDAWTQKPRTNDSEEDSGSSASCDHMDELATMLQDHGIETRVDRRLRDRRISEWLLSL